MVFFIETLSLTQFRSYTSLRLKCDAQPVILTGPNGAGKTNILEAISLMMPGRGLRRAHTVDLKNIQAAMAEYWAVSTALKTDNGTVQVGTGQHPDHNTRRIRINGIDQTAQSVLAEVSSIIWLTPQMDGLFLDSPNVRRRFLDRMVSNFDPKHNAHCNRYERLVRERATLLKQHGRRADMLWLDSLEKQIAETGVIIAAARHLYREQLERAIHNLNITESDFPLPRVEIHGVIDDYLQSHAALDTEDFFRSALKKSRERDSYTGGAQDGTHKSDFRVYHKTLNMPAENCSTGEQKGLLIKLILGQAALVKANRGFAPILLLDDIAAHLDSRRRAVLFETILNLNCQSWMTGTDEADFIDMKGKARYFSIRNSAIKESVFQ